MKSRSSFVALASVFLAGVLTALTVPYLTRVIARKWILPSERKEIARVPSPDGAVDAVTVEIECGAPCSSIYIVSIMPHGMPASEDAQVFTGEDMLNAKTSWLRPSLLTISYDKGIVDNFRSVAYPLGPRPVGGHVYAVELRLSPSSPTFSYLRDVE